MGSLRFLDHDLFLRRSGFLVLSALICALATFWLGPTWWLVAPAGCAALAVVFSKSLSLPKHRLTAVVVFWGAGAAASIATGTFLPVWVIAIAGGLGVLIATAQTGRMAVIMAIVSAAATLCAIAVFERLFFAAALDSVATPFSAGRFAIAGIGAGSAFLLSLLPLHLRLMPPSLSQKLQALGEMPGDLADIAARVCHLEKNLATMPDEHDADLARAGMTDIVMAIENCPKATSGQRQDLLARMARMEQSAASATGEAKEQYELAVDEMATQLDHLQAIDNQREKTIAKLHLNLAKVERMVAAQTRINHEAIDCYL